MKCFTEGLDIDSVASGVYFIAFDLIILRLPVVLYMMKNCYRENYHFCILNSYCGLRVHIPHDLAPGMRCYSWIFVSSRIRRV